MMSYLVIEIFGGAEYAIIVTDENGNNKVSEHLTDAADRQDGIVVEI